MFSSGLQLPCVHSRTHCSREWCRVHSLMPCWHQCSAGLFRDHGRSYRCYCRVHRGHCFFHLYHSCSCARKREFCEIKRERVCRCYFNLSTETRCQYRLSSFTDVTVSLVEMLCRRYGRYFSVCRRYDRYFSVCRRYGRSPCFHFPTLRSVSCSFYQLMLKGMFNH